MRRVEGVLVKTVMGGSKVLPGKVELRFVVKLSASTKVFLNTVAFLGQSILSSYLVGEVAAGG